MKVTVDYGDELAFALNLHLNDGVPVQKVLIAALRFYRDMFNREGAGEKVGFGASSRFTQYNTEASPRRYLEGASYE